MAYITFYMLASDVREIIARHRTLSRAIRTVRRAPYAAAVYARVADYDGLHAVPLTPDLRVAEDGWEPSVPDAVREAVRAGETCVSPTAPAELPPETLRSAELPMPALAPLDTPRWTALAAAEEELP
jgi:hypothetical protein